MQKYVIFKFTDQDFYFYNAKTNKKIVEKINRKNKIIENGKIIDIEEFIIELDTIIKKHHLNNIILKNELYILINSYSTKTDRFLINYALKNLNYYKFKLIEEIEIYKHLLEENTLVLNVWHGIGELASLYKNQYITVPYIDFKKTELKGKKLIVINNTEEDFKLKSNSKNIFYLENTTSPIIEFLIKEIEKGSNL